MCSIYEYDDVEDDEEGVIIEDDYDEKEYADLYDFLDNEGANPNRSE